MQVKFGFPLRDQAREGTEIMTHKDAVILGKFLGFTVVYWRSDPKTYAFRMFKRTTFVESVDEAITLAYWGTHPNVPVTREYIKERMQAGLALAKECNAHGKKNILR